jgi:hypothetical protein
MRWRPAVAVPFDGIWPTGNKHMKKSRGILILLLLICLSGAVGAAAVYVSVIRMPDPESADSRGLMRWLVQRDLSRQPDKVQRTIVDRLLVALPSTDEWTDDVQLNDGQKSLLSQNSQLLKHVWFVSRVERFFQLPPEQHDPYLDEQIDTVARLSIVSDELTKMVDQQTSQNVPDEGMSLMRDMDGWIAEASGSERERMLQAVSSGVVRWLMISDLAQESFALRCELSHRIALHLDDEKSAANILDGRQSQEKAQLRANAHLLMEAWFHGRAEEFARMKTIEEKDAFVDRQIQRIEEWDIRELMASGDQQAGDSTAMTQQMMEMVKIWIDRAPRDRQPILLQFFLNLQKRYFWRLLQWGRAE